MTLGERTAYAAGALAVADHALAAAVALEDREDARNLRQRAAAEALRELAEGVLAALSSPSGPVVPTTPSDAGNRREERHGPASAADRRHAAIAQGYTSDACASCGGFALKRSGSCLVCEACGSTTGCS